MSETFAETPPPVKDSTSGEESIESFNDHDVIEIPDSPQSGTPAKVEKNPKLKEVSQIDNLEDQEDEQKPTKEEPKETKDEKRVEAREAEEAPKTKGIVKGRIDGKMINLDPNMEVRVKVDGKYMNVPINELRDGYSSSTHINEKFANLQEREQFMQNEMDEYVSERDEIQHHFTEIRQKLDDPEGNPMDALYYLLDMTGRNRNDYYKKIISHHIDEVEELQLMSEPERKSYFLEKENEYLKTRHESSTTEMRKTEEEKAFVTNLTSMREARNVTEEQFVDAYNQLIELGETQEQLGPEMVLDYATIYPAVEAAEGVVESFDPELVEDDEVVQEVANAILEDPDVTKDEIIAVLTETFGAPTATREVNKKLGSDQFYTPPKAAKGDDSEKPETFDDLNYYNYQKS